MAYVLEAVVGDHEALTSLVKELEGTHAVARPQGLGLVPLPSTLRRYLDQSHPGEPVPPGFDERFWDFPRGLEPILRRWSRTAPVAYLEADMFGGHGPQAAAVWQHGSCVLGPVRLLFGEGGQASTTPESWWPFNAALALLGARPSGKTFVTYDGIEKPVDLFDEIGLGAHRATEDWLTEHDDT